VIRLSLTLTDYAWPEGPAHARQALAATARAADATGIDTLWVADHLIQAAPTSVPDSEMLEAYGVLAFLAAHSERVRLGAMVSPVTYREPALLVKAATTLDVLSGGRAWLGLGAGYHQAEADAMGLPLPPTAERFERLEETLQIAQRMWAGDATPFEGRHYRLERPLASPAPLGGRLPILIGGTGERRTLPLVARYADACNVFDIPDGGQTVRHKLAVLRRACEAAGRPYDAVEKTISSRLAPGESTPAFVERCRALAELGIQHVVLLAQDRWTPEAIEPLADAAAALAELEPAR
jgi:F420-dependent oxidoreductase-like protein